MKANFTTIFFLALLATSQAKRLTKKIKGNKMNLRIDSNSKEIEKMKTRIEEVEATCKCEPQTNRCPGGWSGFRDSCFLFVAREMNWREAMENCQHLGGYLAQIYDEETDVFLHRMLRKEPIIHHRGPWLGASDTNTEGKWIWATSGKEAIYQNWHNATSEPNGGRRENCLQFLTFTSES